MQSASWQSRFDCDSVSVVLDESDIICWKSCDILHLTSQKDWGVMSCLSAIPDPWLRPISCEALWEEALGALLLSFRNIPVRGMVKQILRC